MAPMQVSIETYSADDDPASVWNTTAYSLPHAKSKARKIFREQGWAKVVLWDGWQSGARPLLTLSRIPYHRP